MSPARVLICGGCESRYLSTTSDAALYKGVFECPACEGTDWHDAATGRACEPVEETRPEVSGLAAHSPGPWTVGTSGVGARDHAVCSGPYVLADVFGEGYPLGKGWGPRSAADARLMASAPTLLAALEGMLEWARRVHVLNPGPEVADACTAIAKARGAVR